MWFVFNLTFMVNLWSLGLCGIYDIENGEVLQEKGIYIQDQSVRVQCYPGYSLANGQDTVTCTENGWSPQLKCIRVSKSLAHRSQDALVSPSHAY